MEARLATVGVGYIPTLPIPNDASYSVQSAPYAPQPGPYTPVQAPKAHFAPQPPEAHYARADTVPPWRLPKPKPSTCVFIVAPLYKAMPTQPTAKAQQVAPSPLYRAMPTQPTAKAQQVAPSHSTAEAEFEAGAYVAFFVFS
jgi:hypothetical protein